MTWTTSAAEALRVSRLLHTLADDQKDSHDHDEMHAAASVVLALSATDIVPSDYIVRWVEGLLHR